MHQLLLAFSGGPRATTGAPQAWLRQAATALLLAAVLGATTSCARHASLQHKTRWYKNHSSGKATPCPCGH